MHCTLLGVRIDCKKKVCYRLFHLSKYVAVIVDDAILMILSFKGEYDPEYRVECGY